ncbi:MAG TPA: glucose 1-dehydrogenase [Pyrinomonadaceae bacterium]|nr:glucose 1-dehydrogenase [Pyrinomonadaceae bacterium]
MKRDPLFSVAGKVVMVTGAGGGVGTALTRAFLGRGATVAAIDRDGRLLDELEAELEIDQRERLHLSTADLSNIEALPAIVEGVVSRAGQIDVLINNAGIMRPGPAFEVDEAEWDAMHTVNLKACFFLARAVARHMQSRRGGRIINIASQLGIVGRDNCAPYTASKGGLVLLTKSLALEWARDKIQVNAIAPGPLLTPMTEPFLSEPQFVQAINAAVPLGRIGSPEEIVGAALLLASEAGSYMTGSVVVVDGGYTAV